MKRLASRPEKYHHSLKALAIREKKIHVVGNPQLRIQGTPVFFDVEGLPDRDFYYLIGVSVGTDQGVRHHSGVGVDGSTVESGVIHVEALGKNVTSKWRAFKSPVSDLDQINVAAHWDYQRDRVFVRSGLEKRRTVRRSKKSSCLKAAQQIIVLKAPASCPECGTEWRKRGRLRSITVQDLVFGRDSVKRRIVKYLVQSYRCRGCRHDFDLHEWYLGAHARKWGWNVLAYFVYHIVSLRVPQLTMQHSLNRLFGFNLVRSTLNNLKIKASDYYLVTKQKILDRIVHGGLVHAGETQANIKGNLAYVWVLTNLREVVYVLAESREAEFIQDLLKDFKGVLVSDFYGHTTLLNVLSRNV